MVQFNEPEKPSRDEETGKEERVGVSGKSVTSRAASATSAAVDKILSGGNQLVMEGFERRDHKKLFKYKYDKEGLRQYDTRSRFSLFSTFASIGKESEALASYFMTLRGLALIILCYCLLASFSFWDFLTKGNYYSHNYVLKVINTDNTTFNANGEPIPEILSSGYCEKFWPVSNQYTRVALGTFCQKGRFNNPLSCQAVCELDVAQNMNQCSINPYDLYRGYGPTDPQNKTFPTDVKAFYDSLLNAGKNPFTDPCFTHMPCAGRYDHGMQAPDGACNCCKFRAPRPDELKALAESIAEGDPSLNAAQILSTMRTGMESLFDLWYLYILIFFAYFGQVAILKVQDNMAQNFDQSKVSAADFSVFITGIQFVTGASEIERLRRELMDYCSHWGDVSQCSPLTSIGLYLTESQNLENLERTKAELEARKAQGSAGGLFGLIYNIMFAGGLDVEKGLTKVEAAIETTKKRLAAKIEKKDLVAIGEAIVIFEDQQAAKNFIADHDVNWFTRSVINAPFIGPLFLSTCGQTLSIPLFRDRHLTVVRAPEPSDIAYDSTDAWGFKRSVQDNMADFLTILFIGIAAGIQFALEYWNRSEQDRLSTLQTSYQLPKGTKASLEARVQVQAVSSFCSLIVVLLNIFLTSGITWAVSIENKVTKTMKEQSILWKLSIAYIVNSFIIPVAASTVTREGKLAWYVVGGLASQAVSLQVSNAVVPAVMQILNPMRTLRLLVAHCAKTPAMVDAMLEPEDFLIATRLANALKTYALGVLFCPIMPISPYIALGSLILQSVVDKLVAFYLAKRPSDMSAELLQTLGSPMFIVQLALLCFSGFVFFDHRQNQARVYFIVAIVTVFVLYFTPFRAFLRCKVFQPKAQQSQEADSVRYHEYLARMGLDAEVAGRYVPDTDQLTPEIQAAVTQVHEYGYLKRANPTPYPGQSSACVVRSDKGGASHPNASVIGPPIPLAPPAIMAPPMVVEHFVPSTYAAPGQPQEPVTLF